MARQGVSRLKVVSSGRLTGSGRGGHIHTKKVAGKCVSPLEPAYSLYSTDSEDQVTTIHKGLDRCATLLDGILQSEQAESKPKLQGTKSCTFKSKAKNLTRKFETEKKRFGNKTKTAVQSNKRPAPGQKKILSAKCHMSLVGQLCSRTDQNSGIRKTQVSLEHPSGLHTVTQTESLPLAYSQPAASCKLPGQVYTSTVFNSRLTTSTPALSPQRPGSTHSEPCALSSSGVFHQSRSVSAAIPSYPHGYLETSGIPNQCAAQRQSPVTVSPVKNGSPTPEAEEVPITTNPFCNVHRVGSSVSLASSIGSSLTVLETQVSNQPQPDPNRPELLIYNGQDQENLQEGNSSAEDENLKHAMDITPVRDISCQTSNEKLTVPIHKDTSPEKTAQNVMTVKYLLGELKTLVANQDSDAVRLISEVEQCISLLPAMVGSTNIQAEIALALQPLRSENVQLRRRLRILNQQLLERERAERRARPEACDMEVVALQSLNLTLQTQLNESREELHDLQQENMRLKKAIEDKDSDLKHLKDLCELENNRLKLQLNEALAETQSYQSKLEEFETEKTALNVSLQQREAEISRLHDVPRYLQGTGTKDDIRNFPQPDLCQPNSQLTKSVLEWHEHAQRKATVSDKLSNSVKTYLQTLEESKKASPSNQTKCRRTLQPDFPGQTENNWLSDTKLCSAKDRNIHKPTLETIAEDMPQLDDQKRTLFAPLRETPVVQIAGINPFNHRNDMELKYMSRGFENLDVSDGLHVQDATHESRNYQSDHRSVALDLNQKSKGPNSQPVQFQHARRCLRMDVQSVMENTFSSYDIKSLASDWSINSCSTFNTQDEQNFRDGLAALDASIESLQKTLKVDLNK